MLTPSQPEQPGIKLFTNPSFGTIRTAGTTEAPLFCLSDVCKAIGITKPSVVRSRLDEEDVCQTSTPTAGGVQAMNYVTEPGLYDVIIRSDSPQAKPFRKWITSEVLPAIRKTGSYGVQAQSAELTEIKECLRTITESLKAILEERKGLIAPQRQLPANPNARYSLDSIAGELGTSTAFLRKMLRKRRILRRNYSTLAPCNEFRQGFFVSPTTYAPVELYSGSIVLTEKGRDLVKKLFESYCMTPCF